MPGAASEPGLRGGPLEINGERVKIFQCMNFFHKTNVCMIFFFWGTSFVPLFRLRAVSYFSLQSYYTQNLSTRAAGRGGTQASEWLSCWGKSR